jgi:hypothetical protein
MAAWSEIMLGDEKTWSRVELAQRLFEEYFAICFWHWKPDLRITEAMIPAVVKELCAHGGQNGMLAASKLQKTEEG